MSVSLHLDPFPHVICWHLLADTRWLLSAAIQVFTVLMYKVRSVRNIYFVCHQDWRGAVHCHEISCNWLGNFECPSGEYTHGAAHCQEAYLFFVPWKECTTANVYSTTRENMYLLGNMYTVEKVYWHQGSEFRSNTTTWYKVEATWVAESFLPLYHHSHHIKFYILQLHMTTGVLTKLGMTSVHTVVCTCENACLPNTIRSQSVVIIEDDTPIQSHSNKHQTKRKPMSPSGDVIVISSDEEEEPRTKKPKKLLKLEVEVKKLKKVRA